MLNVELLSQKVKKASDFVTGITSKRKLLRKQIENVEEKIQKAVSNNERFEKAILLLEFITRQRYESIVAVFENTISAALKDIFDDSYEFRFSFGKRGSLTTCEFEIKNSQYPHWHNIRYAHGRSVQEIVSVILRIILVKLDAELRDVIILDEPLGGLEPDREIQAAKFLAEICEKLKIQILMVTQSPQFAAYAHKQLEI